MQGHLATLAGEVSPGTNVILYGPRGNGKTVLLEWAVRRARSLRIRVISLSMAESEVRQSLFAELSLLPDWLGQLLRSVRGFTAAGAGVQVREAGGGVLDAKLRRRAGRGPLLLALDEAHRMDPVLGGDLLNIVQRLQREDLPVMLLLAGTPDLPRHLNKMGASFWDRSDHLPIGRLGTEDSAAAVRIPLEEAGRPIALDALKVVVRESWGYPFFLQLWGRAIWATCPAATQPISVDAIGQVRPQFQRQRRNFYGKRYEELDEAGLLPVAAGLAAAFDGSESCRPQQVLRTIKASLERAGMAADGKAVKEARRRLRDLGYIWPVYDGPLAVCEPGIPSLMLYVAAQVEGAEPQAGR